MKPIEAMMVLAAEAATEPSWRPYVEYCEARVRYAETSAEPSGTMYRERTSNAIEQLVECASTWSFDERRRFCLWLLLRNGWTREQSGNHSSLQGRLALGGFSLFMPRRLIDAVLLPTLKEWRGREMTNPDPLYWLALYDGYPWDHLNEARRLDPGHGQTRAAIASFTLLAVDYNQHELPSGYLNCDPTEDLASLDEAEALMDEAVEPRTRQAIQDEVRTMKASAVRWIRLRAKLKGLDWEARKALWSRPDQE